MTDETIETPAEQAGATTEQQASANDEQTTGGNKEAAKYRTRLRETEATLEQARAQLAGAQKALLASTVSGMRVKTTMQLHPDALDELHTEGLFGTDGTPDTKAIQSKLNALYDEREYLFRKNLDGTMVIPTVGKTPDTYPRVNESWQGAFTAR